MQSRGPLHLDRLAIYYSLDTQISSHSGGGFGLSSLFFGGGRHRSNSYDAITPRVFVGEMPANGLPPGVNMVLSVCTYRELKVCPIPENAEQIFLHIPDASANVTNEDALTAVLRVKEFLNKHPDNKVLIHCYYGKGRSVMMCAALLVLCSPEEVGLPVDQHIQNVESAFDYIRKKRSVALKELYKVRKAEEVVKFFAEINPYNRVLQFDAGAYLASLEGKDEVRRLKKFIRLAVYASILSDTDKEAMTVVQDFFNSILNSQDGKWYNELLMQTGPLFNIPMSNNDDIKVNLDNPNHKAIEAIIAIRKQEKLKGRKILTEHIDAFISELIQFLIMKGIKVKMQSELKQAGKK